MAVDARATALRFLPPKPLNNAALVCNRRSGLGALGPGRRPPPALWRREGLSDGKVEFPVLRADEEALPFVAVKDVGQLGAVLRIPDRHSPFMQVRYFDAARGTACAALEPAQTGEVGVHPPLPSFDCAIGFLVSRQHQVSSRATC